MQALSRLNIPDSMLKAIGSIYDNPKFQVHISGGSSEIKEQRSGIRQGCPLSPYLFLLTMTVLFDDIRKKAPNIQKGKPDFLSFTELLYADDTLLIMRNTQAANLFLHEIVTESAYCDMALNEGKCKVISTNKRNRVSFQTGQHLENVDEERYLGAILHRDSNQHIEISNRITSTWAVVQKIRLFWREAKCKTDWEIRIFQAVAVNKLLYGMESLHLTGSQIKRFDAFFYKGLRKILGVPRTFIDRTFSNDWLLTGDTKRLHKNYPPSLIIKQRQQDLLGHIVRQGVRQEATGVSEPMFKSTFANTDLALIEPPLRRRGRPKQMWVKENMKRSLDSVKSNNAQFNHYNRTQRNTIKLHADQGWPPFIKQRTNKTRKRKKPQQSYNQDLSLDH